MRIAERSRLSGLLQPDEGMDPQVNSSHHQAIRVPGDNLAVTAVSPGDGVIEAVELDAPTIRFGGAMASGANIDPEAFSRAILAALVQAAVAWIPRSIDESVAPA